MRYKYGKAPPEALVSSLWWTVEKDKQEEVSREEEGDPVIRLHPEGTLDKRSLLMTEDD